jgi:hypothetical protein
MPRPVLRRRSPDREHSHNGIERRHGLIRRWTVTDAAQHDGRSISVLLNRYCQLRGLYTERHSWTRMVRWCSTSPPTSDTASRPKPYAGPIFWDQGQAREIMRWYRDALPKMPPELCAFLGLKTVPSTAPFPQEIWGRRICALICCYTGSAQEGERALRSNPPTHS